MSSPLTNPLERTQSMRGTPVNPVEEPFIQRVESFTMKEDSPGPSPLHADRKIQDAIQPAMLLVSSEGNEVLVPIKYLQQ